MGEAIIYGSVLGEPQVADTVATPLAGATVTAKNTTTNATFTVTTSSGGVFDFDSEPMSYGTYELTAQMSGYDDESMTVTVSESDSTDATFILVASASSSSSKSKSKGLPV